MPPQNNCRALSADGARPHSLTSLQGYAIYPYRFCAQLDSLFSLLGSAGLFCSARAAPCHPRSGQRTGQTSFRCNCSGCHGFAAGQINDGKNGRVIPSIMGCEHGEWKQWFDGDAPMSTSALPAGQLEQSRAPASDQVCRFLCFVHFIEGLSVGKVNSDGNDVLLSKNVRP